ncbi:hypothetical protein FIA58_019325 [Flavobacterium jejuense]|uniref:Uncharacterized protein n=1 Tax=Flavobacterium jejuense TaxID=1544455 RepID=A0ABX0J1I4_9FLAO|nr:hypothetical protein [Flavobacterium jejuense]NHN27834.1 hypothetical protein [Flavobacterium jejuense]
MKVIFSNNDLELLNGCKNNIIKNSINALETKNTILTQYRELIFERVGFEKIIRE